MGRLGGVEAQDHRGGDEEESPAPTPPCWGWRRPCRSVVAVRRVGV